jgi:hypothetical protein
MNAATKIILFATMVPALLFGFLHLFIPGHNFERLHIFLFNLCSGGTLLMIYTEGKRSLSARSTAFYILALLYALLAFFGRYLCAVSAAVALSLLSETIRAKRFRFLPLDFFDPGVPVSEKFHHAAVLCLSIGLALSALVICNHEYWHVPISPRLTLDIFFLGFSFPVSLVTMSLMFGMMERRGGATIRVIKEISFWLVSCGVIIFFVFILLQNIFAELAVSLVLFCAVVTVFAVYVRFGTPLQPKAFLTSGAVFLIMTAVTGIAYIAWYAFIPEPPGGRLLLRLHALISLYGWNLNGLIVICRRADFPIRLNSAWIILMHWAVVAVIAPIGFYFPAFSVIAVAAYGAFLGLVLFARGTGAMYP